MLEFMKENAAKAFPGANVMSFPATEPALAYVLNNGCDILLCEINPPRLEGLFSGRKDKKDQSEGEYYFCHCLLGG